MMRNLLPSSRSTRPKPFRPRIAARLAYALHSVLAANSRYARFAAWLERTPWLYGWFTAGEKATKQALFGCRMCGQCALPDTGYACPMTCPKQLRNGPCGGVSQEGRCEVEPDKICVWLIAHDRAEATGHGADLNRLQRPVDQRLWGQSSWVNYWQGRDDELAADADPAAPVPLLRRQLGLVVR